MMVMGIREDPMGSVTWRGAQGGFLVLLIEGIVCENSSYRYVCICGILQFKNFLEKSHCNNLENSFSSCPWGTTDEVKSLFLSASVPTLGCLISLTQIMVPDSSFLLNWKIP